jgi:hypothetical protein
MRSAARICVVLCTTILICWGCAGSKDILKSVPATINTVNPAKGLNKKIAIALTHTPPTAIGRQVGDLYLRSLIDAIHAEGHQLQLVTSRDADWPDDMTGLVQETLMPGNVLELAAKVRLAGYNGWASARIENMWPVTRKTGFFWFRKDRYYIFLQLTLAVYDPFSGAKIFDEVVETSIEVGEDGYNAFKSGAAVDLENLNEAIADVASDFGEHAAEAINRQPWLTGVVRVEGDRIFLSAGVQAGLRGAERLAVFEGRRIVEGQNGARFIIPGYEVGEIEIVHVTERMSEAKDLTAADGTNIQAGDIAVAIGKK